MSILHWISGDSWRRFIVSATVSVVAYLLLRLPFPSNAIAVWDSFAVSAILLAWLAITVTPQRRLRANARSQDLSRLFIFGVVVTASCVALLAVAFLIRSHHAEIRAGLKLSVVLALGTVALSWLLLHTVYSLHYAHAYYGDSEEDDGKAGGLDFPGHEEPDYFDFAYFSFVVGMTCQVSDVVVVSKRMRRLTLLHAVLSFGYNTFILALLINTVSGLL